MNSYLVVELNHSGWKRHSRVKRLLTPSPVLARTPSPTVGLRGVPADPIGKKDPTAELHPILALPQTLP